MLGKLWLILFWLELGFGRMLVGVGRSGALEVLGRLGKELMLFICGGVGRRGVLVLKFGLF